MNISKKTFVIVIIISLIVGVSIGLAVPGLSGKIAGIGSGGHNETKAVYDKYKKMESIWQTVDNYYYKDVDDKKLEEKMYKDFVNSLGDKYSEYMTKEEYDAWISTTLGTYQGVGLTLQENKDKQIEIIRVNSKGPAYDAGVKQGDIVVKIDGKKYKDVDQAAQAMRGEKGTKVKVTFSRDGKEFTKELQRAEITNESVYTEQMDGKIGYIQIMAFEDATEKDFDEALKACEKAGDRGLIIDMRDNGGGLVDSAVEIADELLGKGTITYLEDKNGKKQYYKSDSSKTDLPYVLLVNEYSASATEIITAAVKDQGDKNIVGQKTYGKGVVQETMQMKDGTALKLTVMQYFSPKGKEINGKGVKPDYSVKDFDEQTEKAEEVLKSMMNQ